MGSGGASQISNLANTNVWNVQSDRNATQLAAFGDRRNTRNVNGNGNVNLNRSDNDVIASMRTNTIDYGLDDIDGVTPQIPITFDDLHVDDDDYDDYYGYGYDMEFDYNYNGNFNNTANNVGKEALASEWDELMKLEKEETEAKERIGKQFSDAMNKLRHESSQRNFNNININNNNSNGTLDNIVNNGNNSSSNTVSNSGSNGNNANNGSSDASLNLDNRNFNNINGDKKMGYKRKFSSFEEIENQNSNQHGDGGYNEMDNIEDEPKAKRRRKEKQRETEKQKENNKANENKNEYEKQQQFDTCILGVGINDSINSLVDSSNTRFDVFNSFDEANRNSNSGLSVEERNDESDDSTDGNGDNNKEDNDVVIDVD